jgi:hypothetical protein
LGQILVKFTDETQINSRFTDSKICQAVHLVNRNAAPLLGSTWIVLRAAAANPSKDLRMSQGFNAT